MFLKFEEDSTRDQEAPETALCKLVRVKAPVSLTEPHCARVRLCVSVAANPALPAQSVHQPNPHSGFSKMAAFSFSGI